MPEAWGHKLTYVVYQPGSYTDDGHGFDAARKLSEALPNNVFVGLLVDKVQDDPAQSGDLRSIEGIANVGRQHGRCG